MKQEKQSKPQLSKKAREARRTKIVWSAIGGVVVAIVALTVVLNVQQNREQARLLAGEETFADAGHEHIVDPSEFDPADYNSEPPTSGPHMGVIAPKAFYDEPIHDAYLVHNMEDGFVVIYYRPDLDAGKLDAIRALAARHNQGAGHSGVVAVPREGISEEVILAAWTKMLRLPAYEEARAEAFVAKYMGIDHHQ